MAGSLHLRRHPPHCHGEPVDLHRMHDPDPDGRSAAVSVSEGYGYDDPTEDDDPTDERWTVDNDRKAAWALRRLAEHQAEVNRINDAAHDEVVLIDQWRTDATRGPQSSIDFHRACLIAYRDRLEADDPELVTKRKTYKLPGGELKRTKGRLSVRVVDEDAFLDWARVNETTAVKELPLVAPLKDGSYEFADGKVVTADGEVVPGVEAVTPDDALTVKVTAEPKGGQR